MSDKEYLERGFSVDEPSLNGETNSFDLGKTDTLSVNLMDDESEALVVCASVQVRGDGDSCQLDDQDIRFTHGGPDGEEVSQEVREKLLAEMEVGEVLRQYCRMRSQGIN